MLLAKLSLQLTQNWLIAAFSIFNFIQGKQKKKKQPTIKLFTNLRCKSFDNKLKMVLKSPKLPMNRHHATTWCSTKLQQWNWHCTTFQLIQCSIRAENQILTLMFPSQCSMLTTKPLFRLSSLHVSTLMHQIHFYRLGIIYTANVNLSNGTRCADLLDEILTLKK